MKNALIVAGQLLRSVQKERKMNQQFNEAK